MGIPLGRPSLTYENIIDTVPEEVILEQCLDIYKLPHRMLSPFREDKKPSLSIYKKDGRVKYIDFGSEEHGSLLQFLSKLWGKNYPDTLKALYDKFILNKDVEVYKQYKKDALPDTKTKTYDKIACVFRQWEQHDLDYWNQYGINKEWAEWANIYPISHKVFYTSYGRKVFVADKYAYCYLEHKDNGTQIKIYQPYNTDGFKWQGNMDRSIWSLWSKLPAKGDRLFITSSLKDALNLWCNTGIPAVSMQGEGYLPKPQIIEQLKQRFKQIIVFYDNDFDKKDNPGRQDSDKLCKEYDLLKVEIPEEFFSKDPSDLFKNVGKNMYLSVINNLLNNLK